MCVRWFVSWLILVVNAKKEAKVDSVAPKRCFFTAGTLLFSSDGTLFDRLLYYVSRNRMGFRIRQNMQYKWYVTEDILLNFDGCE